MPNDASMDEYLDIIELLQSKSVRLSEVEHIVVLDDSAPPLVSSKVDFERIQRIELAHCETSVIFDPAELHDIEIRLDKLAEAGFLTKAASGVFGVNKKFRTIVESDSQD